MFPSKVMYEPYGPYFLVERSYMDHILQLESLYMDGQSILLRKKIHICGPSVQIFLEESPYRRSGGESNREIDFGFVSCVRARALDVESERAQNLR